MWEPLEMVRVHGEFLTLGGGDVWERVELVAWQRREYERVHATEKQREFRSRAHGRVYHRDYERARRVRGKQRPAAVRCCKACRRMWAITATQYADGTRFCSLKCAARDRVARGKVRPPRMVTIDGITRPLPEWAAHFGITPSMVYTRMRAGLSDVEALTKPKRGAP